MKKDKDIRRSVRGRRWNDGELSMTGEVGRDGHTSGHHRRQVDYEGFTWIGITSKAINHDHGGAICLC